MRSAHGWLPAADGFDGRLRDLGHAQYGRPATVSVRLPSASLQSLLLRLDVQTSDTGAGVGSGGDEHRHCLEVSFDLAQ